MGNTDRKPPYIWFLSIQRNIVNLQTGNFEPTCNEPLVELYMLLAVTGTPGTGKTETCRSLEGEGREIIDLTELMMKRSLFSQYDERSDTYEIDVEIARDYFIKEFPRGRPGWIIVDSHLSHLLDVDGIVLLRCDPRELGTRLKGRNYSPEKIRENLESEMVDVIGVEVIDSKLPSIEIDTTSVERTEAAAVISEFIRVFPDTRGFQPPCSVNWIREIHG